MYVFVFADLYVYGLYRNMHKIKVKRGLLQIPSKLKQRTSADHPKVKQAKKQSQIAVIFFQLKPSCYS